MPIPRGMAATQIAGTDAHTATSPTPMPTPPSARVEPAPAEAIRQSGPDDPDDEDQPGVQAEHPTHARLAQVLGEQRDERRNAMNRISLRNRIKPGHTASRCRKLRWAPRPPCAPWGSIGL